MKVASAVEGLRGVATSQAESLTYFIEWRLNRLAFYHLSKRSDVSYMLIKIVFCLAKYDFMRRESVQELSIYRNGPF